MIPVLDQTNDLFNEEIQTPLAWSRSSIKDRSWLIDFPAAVIEELLGFVPRELLIGKISPSSNSYFFSCINNIV